MKKTNAGSAPTAGRLSTLRRILGLVFPYKLHVAAVLAFSLCTTLLSLYIPILTGRAIDRMIEGNVDYSGIQYYILRICICIGIAALTQWVMSYINNVVSYGVVRNLRRSAFEKIHRLPLSYLDSHPSGDILSRVITDAEHITDGLLIGFTQLFSGVVTILGTIGYMLSINVTITLVVVVLSPASFLIASFISKRTYAFFGKQSQSRGELTSYTQQMLDGLKVVKAFGYEQESCEGFDSINTRLAEHSQKAIFYSSTVNPSTRLMYSMIYAGVAVAGGLIALSGNAVLSVGMFSTFLSYTNQYTKPFNEITSVITEFQNSLASAERVFGLLDSQELTPDSEQETLGQVRGEVEFESVCFSYTPERRLIENFNVRVTDGMRVAIVGPTGCGKTTLINLLMRFYDVREGAVRVDGVDIRDVPRDELRRNIGMVLQDTWLMEGSVRDNIAFGRPDATDEEVIAAAKEAHAHSFIMRMPDGYGTHVDEGGGNLSAGQKQLLCIARVMLSMPPMLILDEATSSIDTMTELRVQRAFEKMMRGRTSFIVAHRLSTIREADLILVMREGNIVEQGTHEELLSAGGFYHALYNSQFAGQ